MDAHDCVSVFEWMSETTSDCITGSAAMLTDHNSNSNNNHIYDFTHKKTIKSKLLPKT